MKKVFKKIGNLFYKNRYFFSKLLFAFITLVLTTFLVFFILLMTPGDVVENYAMQLRDNLRIDYDYAYKLAVQTLGYDPNANWFKKFGDFLISIFNGKLGVSLFNEEITGMLLIKQKLPWTLFISSVALIISFLLGTSIGSVMAKKRGGIIETLGNSYVMIFSAIPDYIIGLLLLVLFSYKLKIFPSSGNYDVYLVKEGFNFDFIINVLYHACLPILAYVLAGTCGWIMLMRSNVVGILGEDYISCAKARGIPEKRIINKYMKRNAMLPLITQLALSFAALFGGSALIESVFNYPGLGLEFANRVGLRDYYIMAGLLFLQAPLLLLLTSLLIAYILL